MRASHGADASAVREAPPLSVRVSSWTAHTLLSDLCRADHTGVGARPGVRVARAWGARGRAEQEAAGQHWVFEPHPKGDKTSSRLTRPRWVLLALALDLEARLRHDAALHAGRVRRFRHYFGDHLSLLMSSLPRCTRRVLCCAR